MNGNIRYLIEQELTNNMTEYYYVYWPYSEEFMDDEEAYMITKSEAPDMIVPVKLYEERFGTSEDGRLDTIYILIDWPEAHKYYDDPEVILPFETRGAFIPYNE